MATGRIASRTRVGDQLSATHVLAAADRKPAQMVIGSHDVLAPHRAVIDHHAVAVSGVELGVDDLAARRRIHARAAADPEIRAVVQLILVLRSVEPRALWSSA